jgi:hypothetical protein
MADAPTPKAAAPIPADWIKLRRDEKEAIILLPYLAKVSPEIDSSGAPFSTQT